MGPQHQSPPVTASLISQNAHHHVTDDQSMSSFFRVWAEFARVACAPSPPLPFHDRASVSLPRDPPRVAFNHREIEFMNDKVVQYSAEFMSALFPDLEVDSWLRFRFHELDFGSGGPCAFLRPELPVEGLLVFVPSIKEISGVDVFLALEHEHGKRFREIYHYID
ncbi:Agmatine coumaroyltransferase-1 [Acorus calamus]|uniref:Agmatine coumaroyltransferase-1 n=1 Tax=Acorus calamus TaxID=4465 RepID=A0AAV9DRH6_ACOCL|nr:Agmatine coumaroyltransferase-1 [Acorus calamus]